MAIASLEDLGTYTDAELDAAIRANGRRVRFRYELMTQLGASKGFISSVRPGGRVTYDWLAEIKRGASFNLVEDEDFPLIDFVGSDCLKPYFQLLMPDGLWASFPLGVFILESPTRASESGRILRSVTAYDRGIILREEVTRGQGRYVMKKDTNIVEAVRGRLDTRDLPHDIPDDDATAPKDRAWEVGTSIYVVVNDMLDMINYTSLYFDENGIARSKPYTIPGERAASISYETDEMSVTSEAATDTQDVYDVPNRWIMHISQPDRDPVVMTYTNYDPSSPTSVPNRGRVITRVEQESDDAVTRPLLRTKLRRLAHEDSSVYGQTAFSTILDPRHGENNIVYLRHDPLGIDGEFSETNWEMTLEAGHLMTHQVRYKVSLRDQVDILSPGRATFTDLTANKVKFNSINFVQALDGPVQVITQPNTSVPGTTGAGTFRGHSSNNPNPLGVNVYMLRSNTTDSYLMYMGVPEFDEEANMASGSIRVTGTPNAITTTAITFGKTLTGTVRVFFDINGGACDKFRRVGVTGITSTGADLSWFSKTKTKRRLRWFAIGDDGGQSNIAVGTTTIAVGSPPGVGSAGITFGKTLADPVYVFSVAQSAALVQGLTGASGITNTGATLYSYRENNTVTTQQWVAVGGLGEGADDV